jgi:hypothetical protein
MFQGHDKSVERFCGATFRTGRSNSRFDSPYSTQCRGPAGNEIGW